MSARGRAGSAPWSRLKPANLDPLEAMGLPSKGDNRLLEYKNQERYYMKIVERYMAFCSDAGKGNGILRRLASLDISNHKTNDENTRDHGLQQPATPPIPPTDVQLDSTSQKDLSILMMAMRKLREGIVASNRVDDFSIQAYIFCIRFSILVKHMESYHPAILHLLKKMHTVQPLTTTELYEFVGYLILDLACRQNDLAEAFLVRHRYKLRDSKIDAVLQALVHDNYFLFWRVKRTVDGHKAKLMEFAEKDLRKQTLKCLGRSYLGIDLPALEQCTGSNWLSLTKDNGVGWHLEGTMVIIRKLKAP